MEKGKADRGPGITARLWDSSLIQNSASESLQIGQRSEMKGSITMKKLMIAASAALCATVSLAELASANIVGFQGADVPKGYYNIQGVMFQDVSGTTIDLQNVKMGDNDLLDASTTLRTWSGSAWVDFVYGELVDADWNNITDADGNNVIGWGQDPDGMMAAFQLAEPKILRPGEGFLATASGGTTGSAQMLFKNPFYVAE